MCPSSLSQRALHKKELFCPLEAIDVDGHGRCHDFSNGPQVPVHSYARIEQRDALARQKFVQLRHAKKTQNPVKRACLHLSGNCCYNPSVHGTSKADESHNSSCNYLIPWLLGQDSKAVSVLER
jgi:hypothetical protein